MVETIDVKGLTDEEVKFVVKIVESLRKNKVSSKKLKFDWEDGLSDIKGEFTSVKLQHSSLGWR